MIKRFVLLKNVKVYVLLMNKAVFIVNKLVHEYEANKCRKYDKNLSFLLKVDFKCVLTQFFERQILKGKY